jgi:peptidoglycan hydrolase-like protein with peptidoglycan-binding domain
MTRAEIIALQRQLLSAGYGLKVDGVYGPRTAEAYQDWLNSITPSTALTPAPVAAKPWYLSRSILGILATAIAGILGRSGYLVDASELTNVLLQVVEIGGLLLAFVGTVKRRAPIAALGTAGVCADARAHPVRTQRAADKPDGPFGYQ